MKKKWIMIALAVACTIALAGCKIVSEPEPIAVQSVTLNTTTLTLTIEDDWTRTLTATVYPYNADNRTVTWYSSNTEVADVDYWGGVVTAHSEGTTTISAYAGSCMATCEVTVKHKTVGVNYVTLNETTITLEPNARHILTATVHPDNADDKSVTWSSSNPEVARVYSDGVSDGMVVAINEGTATITAHVGEYTASCTVYVNETFVEQPDSPIPVESITLNTYKLILEPNTTSTLTADVMPSDADNKTVIWSTSDYWVATVDYYDGTVTAHNEGTATITAWADGKTAECEVTVRHIANPVTGVTLDKTELTLTREEEYTLTATVTPDDADDKTVAWYSSDPYVATVNHDGILTAHTLGTTTITAQAGDMRTECEITVNPILVESITLDKTTLTLAPDMTKTLTATVTPSNADDTTVEWSTSNAEVATVGNDGKITAHKVGTTTITAITKEGGKTAKCTITVHDNHIYSGGKCTVCGANQKMNDGTIDENGVLTKYSGSETKVVIPEGVTGIGNYAFNNCTSLANVTIPNSVKSIGDYAFDGCTNLTSVTIPNSVTSIGNGAFGKCESLASVTIPASVTSIGSSAFNGCTSLKNVTISNSVKSIGDYAFSGCTSLTNVTIPNSVKSIGNYAFRGCTNLTSVTIPNNVTSIGDYAFSGCTSLTSMTIPNSVTSIGNYAFEKCESLASVTIPASVTSIGSGAFNGCTSLENVTIPNSVKSIGNYTFRGCTSLTNVTIPNNVTSIGNYVFDGCTSLTSITIPDSVTSIRGSAFFRCTNLRNVTIPSSVTSIESSTFNGCTSLASVKIPASVTSIEGYAFEKCTSLTSVTIPNNVTSIGDSAFYECTSLTSVEIPASVTSIERYAFKKCTSLTSVNYSGTKEQWKAITKSNTWNTDTGSYTIICTDGSLSKE